MASDRKVLKFDGLLTGSGFVLTVEYDDGETVEYKRSVNGTPLARSGGKGIFRPVNESELPREVYDNLLFWWPGYVELYK